MDLILSNKRILRSSKTTSILIESTNPSSNISKLLHSDYSALNIPFASPRIQRNSTQRTKCINSVSNFDSSLQVDSELSLKKKKSRNKKPKDKPQDLNVVELKRQTEQSQIESTDVDELGINIGMEFDVQVELELHNSSVRRKRGKQVKSLPIVDVYLHSEQLIQGRVTRSQRAKHLLTERSEIYISTADKMKRSLLHLNDDAVDKSIELSSLPRIYTNTKHN